MGWNDATTATASTSMSRSSRTSRRTSTAVLAGGCWVLTYWSRTSRTTGELGGVDQVVGELDHLLEAGPNGLQRGLEVVEHLPRLDANVARPNQRPRAIEGDLSSDVDRPTRGYLHHMGVAGRVVHRLGVDEVGRDGHLPG